MRSVDAKIAVLGSQGVGKTSVVVRYVSNTFNNYISPTIGASFFTCPVVVDDCRVKLQLWDTAGQERFRSMAPMYYRNSNAAILVYDITSSRSFDQMKLWLMELKRNVDTPLVICVVGNKSDLCAQQTVSTEMAQQYTNSVGAKFFETSALSSQGVQELFTYIAERIKKQDAAKSHNLEESDVFTLHESSARSKYLASAEAESSVGDQTTSAGMCGCNI